VEAARQAAPDRFALQQALMPYQHLLPERLRGRNERVDEPFAPPDGAAPATQRRAA
jgi:fumarate reductase flavoprotein subunit